MDEGTHPAPAAGAAYRLQGDAEKAVYIDTRVSTVD